MATHPLATNPGSFPQPIYSYPPQPFIAPGLSLPEANNKFLGVFTASHLSICLLVSGFGLIVTGLLGVVTRVSLDPIAFQAVGISLICFGSVLIFIAIAIFVFAIRWGRKKVHVMDRHISVPIFPTGYSLPIMTNPNINQNSGFDNSQNPFTTHLNSLANQTFYTIPVSGNGLPNGSTQQFVVIRPTAPPLSPDSTNH